MFGVLTPTPPLPLLGGGSLSAAHDVHSSPCRREVGRAATGRGSNSVFIAAASEVA